MLRLLVLSLADRRHSQPCPGCHVGCEGRRRIRRYTWWRHQMKTFSALLNLCEGNLSVTGEFPHKGQWRGALMFSLIYTWTNGWVNNRGAGDLRRHCAHYDVTVMATSMTLRLVSHEGRGVLYLISATRQFAQQLVQININKYTSWPFVEGNHQWLADSSLKAQIIRKVTPRHDGIMFIFRPCIC